VVDGWTKLISVDCQSGDGEEFGRATSGVAVLEGPSLEISVDSGDDGMLSSGLSFEASKDALVGFRQALCIKTDVCLEAVDPSHKAGQTLRCAYGSSIHQLHGLKAQVTGLLLAMTHQIIFNPDWLCC
jgi:hypothetical protein